MQVIPSIIVLIVAGFCGLADTAAQETGAQENVELHTLTVIVENVNREDGNIGVLVFNSPKGWPEDRFAALRDVVVPAHPGTVTVSVPGLPAGDYAVAVAHDVNKNHKLDRNFLGVPKEQWGMSNNPHATVKAPSFPTARFSLADDQEIHVRMQ